MIQAALALVTLVLAAVLVLQWKDWPRSVPPVQGQAPVAAPSGAEPQPGPLAGLGPPEGKDTYASVSERPLFRPQRKPEEPLPDEPAADLAPEQVTALEGIDLSAVLIAPGLASAWIKDPALPNLKRLRLGDDYGGWQVKDIQADRLVLERQGETNQLILRDFSQVAPGATPPAAPPQARRGPVPQRRPTPPQPAQTQTQMQGDGQGSPSPRPPPSRPNVPRPQP